MDDQVLAHWLRIEPNEPRNRTALTLQARRYPERAYGNLHGMSVVDSDGSRSPSGSDGQVSDTAELLQFADRSRTITVDECLTAAGINNYTYLAVL